MKRTIPLLVLGGLAILAMASCRRNEPPVVKIDPPKVNDSSKDESNKKPEQTPTPMRQAIQKRRGEAESKNHSAEVKQALQEFNRSAVKVEKQLDAAPEKGTKLSIDLSEPASHAVLVWQAAHPKVRAGPAKRLSVPGYKQGTNDNCGPTAVRSVIHFHQNRDPGIEKCRNAVFTDFVGTLTGTPIVGNVIGFSGFTMPSGIKIGVQREFKLPCAQRRHVSPDDLRLAVDHGRPPIILVRGGEKVLHWLVVIGYESEPNRFDILDPDDGKEHSYSEANILTSWNLDGSYVTGMSYGDVPGVLKGHRRVTVVINDNGADDSGTAEFVVEQIAILGLESLRRGADPRNVADAMNIVANVVGANSDLGKAIKAVGNVAEALASGAKPIEAIKSSVGAINGLLQQAGLLPQDSKLADKAKRAVEIAGKIDDLFKRGLKKEAEKLINEFTGISKEFTGILGDPGKSLGIDGAMAPALGVLQAGLAIADICRKWGSLSDLQKVSASLEALGSAAMAAQAFCSVAVCEVKGPIMVLISLLKDLINLGIDLGVDLGINLGGGGSHRENGGSDGKADKKSDPSSKGGGEPSAAEEAAKQASDRGASAAQIGKAVAAAVNDPSVEQPVADAVANAKKKGEDVVKAVSQVEKVKKATEQQQRQDAETAKQAADDAMKSKKADNPVDLAEAAVRARKELAVDHENLQNLIAAELKAGRSPEEVVRRALIRLRAQKALDRAKQATK